MNKTHTIYMKENKKYHMLRVVSNVLSNMLIIYNESFRILSEIFLNVASSWNNVILKCLNCHVTVLTSLPSLSITLYTKSFPSFRKPSIQHSHHHLCFTRITI